MVSDILKYIAANINIVELRNWLLLFLGATGAFISVRTFVSAVRQRKIDNTYKTIDYLRKHIGEHQIETFVTLFHANNELSGVKFNEFRFDDGRTETIEDMFSEAGCGNGDIHNMIELFNLVSPTFNNLEVKIIWYEYGQIMGKIYGWTDYLEEKRGEEFGRKHQAFYFHFNRFMKKRWKQMLLWPTKRYTYAE